MHIRLQKPAVILAALLQVLPLVRTMLVNPATGNTFAFILRWGIGTGAVLGSVDAVSAATSTFTTPSTFSGTVGTAFSQNVTVSIGGGSKAAANDYFFLSAGTVTSTLLMNGQSTTATLPPGLTFTASWVNNATTIGGTLTGTPTAAGTYATTVTVVSPGNATLSQTITLTITGTTTPTAPAITKAPSATNVVAGKTATFTATASGTAPLGYFWLKNNSPLANGGNIAGATTATLTLTTVAAADAANYSVLVSNSVGTATSTAAALTVILPPTITDQPAAQAVASGVSASFSVTATGSAPLAYQWLKNGAAIANGAKYSGVTTSGLTVTTAAAADTGNYSVVITNAAGSVTSAVAPLTIVATPTITTPPANLSVVAGASASFTVTAAGSAPLFYFWLKNNSPLANGGNVSGANTATLTVAAVAAADAGNYSVIVSNSLGTITSTAAALTVILPPTITAQPAAQAVASGISASFAVTASGSAPLAYQWLKNGAAIANGAKYSGVTASALTVTAVATADTGNYSVVITNAAGSVTSAVAPLTIVATPTITAPPANLSVVAGANASFTVSAAGSAPLFYFWLKNNSPLANGGNVSGVSTANLILSTVTTNDAASYSVIVSNSLGTITSPAASLTVSVPPAIITSPADATLIAGSNVSFTVTASGTAPLVYQWKKNGAAIANGGNVSGANTASLTLANLAAADAANYSATVTNAVGSATSAAAALTVLVPPAITTAPASTSVVQGNPVSFSATAAGTAPLSFQWLKNGAAIPGAVSNVLTLSAVSTNDAANYSVVVTNIAGSAASSSAALTVLVPPTITTQPADITALAGSNVSFTVTASGTAPLTYQWKKSGANLVGATSATLSLNNISTADTASYSVVVSNAAGTATSSAAVLAALLPPAIVTQPANQFGALGSTINLAVVASGTGLLSYQWFQHGSALADGGNISGSATTNLTITGLTTNEVDTYSVVISNAYGTVTSPDAKVSINASPIISVPPTSQIAARSNAVTFSVTATGTGPLAYQWRKNGTNLINAGIISGATTPTLALANVTTNNNGNYSVVITNIYGSITSSVATLAVFTPPAITGQPTNRAVVVGSNVTFAVTTTGSGPLNFQWFKNGSPLADGGNISGSTTNILKLSALTTADAGNYSVTVGNVVGSATSSNATLTMLVPPAITAQPASQSVTLSNAATFSVSATGTAPLRYQWRKTGVAIAGATNASFSLALAMTADVAAYSVVVTNLAGSVTSSNATLTVNIKPAFTTQAANRWAKAGSNTVFTATVSGTAPFSYQWFKNGVALTDGGNISGSLSNVLTVANLTTNDNGAYCLTASNVAGSATSTNALLAVIVPPAITTQPVSQSVTLSNAATFSVSATGTETLRYQWRKASVAIAGATNFTYTIASAKTTDAAAYSVVITNLAGSVTSSNATLTVNVKPAFTLQAASRWAKAGSNTVFTATVSGTAPFSYQWFKDGVALIDGGNISGSLSNVLTVANLTTNDNGAYCLTANNVAGSATSTNALLAVIVPPAITTQPASQAVGVSNTVTFTVAATGTEKLRYQWRKAGMAIFGATNFTHTIASAKLTDAGVYSVVVMNLAGSVTSSNAALTVWLPPVLTIQATNRTATNGTTTVFRAAVSGMAPFSYQWFKDGVALTNGGNISGSFSNVLTITNVQTSNAGAYALTVRNPGAAVTSSNAVLKVVSAKPSSSGDDEQEEEHDSNIVQSHSLPNAIISAKAIASIPPVLQISASNSSSVSSKISSPQSSGFVLTCTGTPGANYILQATDDLANWFNVSTNTADASGHCQMSDNTKSSSRFYRLQVAP